MTTSSPDQVLDALCGMPLFKDIDRTAVASLLNRCLERRLPAGATLFSEGDDARKLYILIDGEIKLVRESREVFRISGVQLVGELGAMTGIPRNTTATLTSDSLVLSISGDELTELLQEDLTFGIAVYRNLVSILAEKAVRDKLRQDEMRENLIRTQKEMKRIADLILEQPETPLSEPIFDALQENVARNRRANYRVKPTPQLPAFLDLDGLRLVVLNMSAKDVALHVNGEGDLPNVGDHVSGVLHAADLELPLSGDVVRRDTAVLAITLDLMIEEYEAQLTDYLVRVQMLSFVV